MRPVPSGPPTAADEHARFAAAVAGLPADEQSARVAARLRQLNPRFHGVLDGVADGPVGEASADPQVVGGRVVRIALDTGGVSDIRPLAALGRLAAVVLRGRQPPTGWLSDLSPLRGLGLRSVDVTGTPVADLAPLRGMPRAELVAGYTGVADLAPLAGRPLAVVSVMNTPVADLRPLAGPDLKDLRFDPAPDRYADLARRVGPSA